MQNTVTIQKNIILKTIFIHNQYRISTFLIGAKIDA